MNKDTGDKHYPGRPIDGVRWSEMDPNIRLRFHEIGNHVTRLEGIITGLSMRVPEKPGTVPLIEEKVRNLEGGQQRMEQKVDKLSDKLNSLTIKIVGGTTVLTGLVTALVQIAFNAR